MRWRGSQAVCAKHRTSHGRTERGRGGGWLTGSVQRACLCRLYTSGAALSRDSRLLDAWLGGRASVVVGQRLARVDWCSRVWGRSCKGPSGMAVCVDASSAGDQCDSIAPRGKSGARLLICIRWVPLQQGQATQLARHMACNTVALHAAAADGRCRMRRGSHYSTSVCEHALQGGAFSFVSAGYL